jgi:hypothetical protein
MNTLKLPAIVVLGALALGVLAAGAAVRAAVESGRTAPDFTVTDIAGRTHRLSEYRGRIVVLEWLSPGCPFVQRHYRSGSLPGTQTEAAADGVIWLQVNSSAIGDLDPAQTEEWRKKQGVVATAYIRDVSGKLGRLFGAEKTPHLYVISREGIVVYQGAIDDQPNASVATTLAAHNYVKAALAALKAGRPVETARTAPYGCGVKYGAETAGDGR